ncbi:hypothetical protein M3A96_01620 [Helcobacillus massiliensis]|uniref:hypothetical protein n=1 Tax=Helcobacillus massiliensis TaxID=521392 RepID=UPI0021A3485C|nr:hypothetical protein [Helcobacillus massiliensis]MCT1556826.1 hypothetical protein [Helcobacillus massiliensis]MCT2035650.1 hypothetical protein [Helcobacillus massiliensis]MCT2330898.1 hypothetical protein [Helcobacillus massiliensis]
MALLPRTKRAAEKKAAVKKKHLSKKAQKNASKAQTRAQKAMASIGPLVAVAAEQARERAAGYYEDYAPVVQKNVREGLKKGGERFGDLASNLNGDYAKKAKQFRGDFEDDYLPRARNTASAASDTAAAALTAALAAARKEWDKGAGDIQKAATASPKKKKSVFGKLLLVTGLAAAGAAVGYVVWQKTRPIEDPWAPPADFARAHYPAAGTTDADSADVSDSVASAEAGDLPGALKRDPKSLNTNPGSERPVTGKRADTAVKRTPDPEAKGGDVKRVTDTPVKPNPAQRDASTPTHVADAKKVNDVENPKKVVDPNATRDPEAPVNKKEHFPNK